MEEIIGLFFLSRVGGLKTFEPRSFSLWNSFSERVQVMLERKWSDGPPVVVSPSSPTDVSRKSFSGGVDGVNVKQVHGGFLSSYILAEVVRNTLARAQETFLVLVVISFTFRLYWFYRYWRLSSTWTYTYMEEFVLFCFKNFNTDFISSSATSDLLTSHPSTPDQDCFQAPCFAF